MKLFKTSINRLKFQGRPGPRRLSSDLSSSPSTSPPLSKRPSITMLPHDSAASLPTSPPHYHARLNSQGLYCPKRPNLPEILSGRSSRPWTLEAFTAYCEQNLCVENLRFIQEAEQYEQRHRNWIAARHDPPDASDVRECAELISQWRMMLAHYLAAGGPQEVNLPGDVRDKILSLPDSALPAHPQILSAAVHLTHRLIEDSILFPFLNDTRHDCAAEDHIDFVLSPKDEMAPKSYAVPLDGRLSRPASREAPSPTSTHSTVASSFLHKKQAVTGSDNRSRSAVSYKDSYHSSGSTSIDAVMIDDSTASMSNPSVSHTTSRSPPMSPPGSLYNRPSPRPRSDSSWRKFGAKLGFSKKKRSNSQLRSVSGEGAIED